MWGPAIGSYQAISHPLAKAKIEVDLAAMMTAKAAVAAVDHVIQLHGGNGLSAEYGMLPQWGLARLLRSAPVSREMILDYVAQHTLSLPRSY